MLFFGSFVGELGLVRFGRQQLNRRQANVGPKTTAQASIGPRCSTNTPATTIIIIIGNSYNIHNFYIIIINIVAITTMRQHAQTRQAFQNQRQYEKGGGAPRQTLHSRGGLPSTGAKQTRPRQETDGSSATSHSTSSQAGSLSTHTPPRAPPWLPPAPPRVHRRRKSESGRHPRP